MMKCFYISSKRRIKRLRLSTAAAGAGPTKGKAICILILCAVFLPFLFLRFAFTASLCTSPLECIRWSIFGGSDTSLKLREELIMALVEAREGGINNNGIDGSMPAESFSELVREMTNKRQDVKAFAFRTKAMLSSMELKVQSARRRELFYWHLASHGIPKSLHCLCLRLAEEYAVNAMARSWLPPPEYVLRLVDPSFHHVVLLTDNIIGASVVISSAVRNAAQSEKLVFHVVTDKKTYTSMHAWFATTSIESAVVEVKGLHQYDWSQGVNVGVKEMMAIHRLIWNHYYISLKKDNFEIIGENIRSLDALRPSHLSLLNHLRIYIPELFPDLNKIVFLDDDVVVQQDISSLWEMDLNQKVVGAVVDSWCGENCCPGSRYEDYLNFSNPLVSSNFDRDRCAWLYGMNVFDLDAWRTSNITENYHKWLKQSLISGFELWRPGVLPPALLAFEGQVHPIDPLWHVAGLGFRPPEPYMLEAAAIIHFSGPAKPWLEIGFPEVRDLWYRHVNFSNKFIRRCRITG